MTNALVNEDVHLQGHGGSGEAKGSIAKASKMGLEAVQTLRKLAHEHIRLPSRSSSPSVPEEVLSSSPLSSSLSISIAPPNHREKTALHALKDTFVLPNPSSFIPTLPTIPCMSGLGHFSPIFHDQDDYQDDGDGYIGDQQEQSKDAFHRLTGSNVLMMGGYRGSILRDAQTGRRLWVPLRVGFNVRKADLAIGLTNEDELSTTETVVAGKSLAAIAGFVDLGKRLKDRLKTMEHEGKITFTSWGYDWRRNLDLSSAELTAHLEKVKARTGKGTLIIAHSMGGLVALHALARALDPSIITGIIFGSTPFLGTPNILQPFRWGDSILLNKEICSPSTVFSFRSSFYLLPPNGICFENTAGTLIPMDFHSSSDWSHFGFSPMTARIFDESKKDRKEAREEAEHSRASGLDSITTQQLGEGASSTNILPSLVSPPVSGQEKQVNKASETLVIDYLERTLERVKKFRKDISDGYDIKKAHLYPPLVIIASQRTATVRGAIIDSKQELLDGNFDRLLFGEGDGIILHSSATALPEVWQPHLQATVDSRHGHVSLLSDLGAMRKAFEAIYNSDKRQ